MKKFRKLKIFGIIVLSILIFFVTINIIPPKKVVEDNPFLVNGDLPMIAAHRGGADNAPENTMAAYKKAVYENETDIIETDVCLTKDNKLVFNHDSTIDRMSDVDLIKGTSTDEKTHKVRDYTLEELKYFNFAYGYKDENDNYPYQELLVGKNDSERLEILSQNEFQIVEFTELFAEFYQTKPDLMFIIEIKDSGEDGKLAAKILYETLNNNENYRHYLKQMVIGTFNDEIEQELKEKYPDLLRGASTGSAAKFVFTEILKVNLFDNSDFSCLQIPMGYEIKGIELDLAKKAYVNRAHRRGMAVQYWTIDDASDMKVLIELGVDAIMTNNPELLKEILKEYK